MSEPKRAKTVLVVDDDPEIVFLVSYVLAEEGYGVLTAADGAEALVAVARGMPDLILLDMKMPVMNGSEFAQQYHARYNPRAPIVVLTATSNVKKAAEEVGAVGYVGKPFDLDTLVAVVKQHVS